MLCLIIALKSTTDNDKDINIETDSINNFYHEESDVVGDKSSPKTSLIMIRRQINLKIRKPEL